MAETISPTRMNLLQRQNQVKLAQQGVDLLKRKRDALVADFFNIVRRALAAREKLTRAAQESYALLGLAKAVEGREVLEAAALADPRRLEVAIETKNIWGTRIPTIGSDEVRRSLLARGYDPVAVTVRTVESAERFEDVVAALLDVASTEVTLRKIGEEIKKTTRRVNALEQVVIPRIRGEWRETVRTILDKPGAVVMLGPVDVGKTTVATALANAALRARLPAAVVDADPGQSDIGPPATAALGVPDRPVGRMSEIAPSAAWFVGDTSPRLVAGDLVEGTARLVRRARRQGARVIVVDTAGWVEGPAAVATVLREILGVRPRHVVAIQRGEEVEPILARVPGDIAVHRLPPSPHARPRSRDERRAYREQAFARYFAGARPVSLELLAIPCRRPVRYRGRAIPHGRLLAEVPPEDLRHLLVGLVDRYGWLVALGTVLEVYPSSQRVEVLSPLGSLSRVRALHWGVLRVAPSGREQGRLPLVA